MVVMMLPLAGSMRVGVAGGILSRLKVAVMLWSLFIVTVRGLVEPEASPDQPPKLLPVLAVVPSSTKA